jgi:hypothetical protein
VIAIMLLVATIFPLVTRRPGEGLHRPFWQGVFPRQARARG